jgi:hypothetical protein
MTPEENLAPVLIEFFTRLAEDQRLYNDYLDDPLKVMRDNDIPEDLITLILQGNLKKINRLLAPPTEDSDHPAVICGTIVRG